MYAHILVRMVASHSLHTCIVMTKWLLLSRKFHKNGQVVQIRVSASEQHRKEKQEVT